MYLLTTWAIDMRIEPTFITWFTTLMPLSQMVNQHLMDPHASLLQIVTMMAVLQLCFTWLQTDVVKMTLAETMQHACMPLDTILRKHYKSPDQALNVMKHH